MIAYLGIAHPNAEVTALPSIGVGRAGSSYLIAVEASKIVEPPANLTLHTSTLKLNDSKLTPHEQQNVHAPTGHEALSSSSCFITLSPLNDMLS